MLGKFFRGAGDPSEMNGVNAQGGKGVRDSVALLDRLH